MSPEIEQPDLFEHFMPIALLRQGVHPNEVFLLTCLANSFDPQCREGRVLSLGHRIQRYAAIC